MAEPWTETSALAAFFNPHLPGSGIPYFSCYTAALNDARRLSNRNPSTGATLPGLDHGNWFAALGYLIMLDQLGSAINRVSFSPTENDRTIVRALEIFHPTQFDARQAETLYALRCSFAHDFNLFNRHGGRPFQQCHFRVTQGTGLFIQYPAALWNGVFSDANDSNTTTVDLEELGNFVETVHSTVMHYYGSNSLSIRLSGGPEELIKRYVCTLTFRIRTP